MPQFSQNKKGYDPEEVDKFVNEQVAQLQTAIQRAATAEAQLSIANSNLAELQRRVDELDQSLSQDTLSEGTISVTMPKVEETLGQQIQAILNTANEAAAKIEQAAHQEAAQMKQKAEDELSEIQAQTQSLNDQLSRARSEADMIRSEAKAELEIELRAQREAAEVELSRRRAELDNLEQNREQEMRLRLEDKQGQLMKEHEEKMTALNEQKVALETQIASLAAQKEKAISDLANLQNMLRQAVGGINLPETTPTENVQPVEQPIEQPNPIATEESSEPSKPSPKIEPMGASSVPFEDDQNVSNSNVGINGDEKVMMVPTIAGMAPVPTDSTGEPTGSNS